MFWSRDGSFWRRTDVRLTLWYSGTLLTVLALACGFLGYRLHRHMMKQVDAVLIDEAQEIQALLRDGSDLSWTDRFKAELRGRTRLRIYFRLLDSQGREIVSSSPKFPWSQLSLEPDSWKGSGGLRSRSFEWRSLPYREVTVRPRGGQESFFLQVGMDLKQVRNAMGNFYRNVTILVPSALLFCVAGGWLLARRSLSPIREIASTADRISSQNLGERLKQRGSGDDLDELVGTINRMLDRLDRSFQEIRRFSADVAHELRTPLCAMRGEAELLLSRYHSVEEYQEVLERFAEQFDRLNKLTSDLLLLARFEARPQLDRSEELDLGDLLLGLTELFEALAEEKGIRLEFSAKSKISVCGDRALLQQAFANLIHNAIQYTPGGGQVKVTCEREGAWVRVSVQDTGVGIPEQDLPHVFKRFYRVEKSRSRDTGGSGLGLSISQRILEAHGGGIRMESTWGQGTNVEVQLPLSSSGVCS